VFWCPPEKQSCRLGSPRVWPQLNGEAATFAESTYAFFIKVPFLQLAPAAFVNMPSKLCIPCSSILWDKFPASVEDGTHTSYSFSYRPSPTTGVGNNGCSICKVLYSTCPELCFDNVTVRISSIYNSEAPGDSSSSHTRYLILRFERALTDFQTLNIVEFNVCGGQGK
jgi:hypothetical protein